MRLGFLLLLTCLLLSACNKSDTTLQGYIEGDFIYLSSPVAGELQQLTINRGQTVSRAQLIFQLDPEPEQARLASAQAELEQVQANLADAKKGQRVHVLESMQAAIKRANAQLAFNEKQLQRFEALLKADGIDENRVEQARTETQAQAELVKQLQANLAEAKQGGRADVLRSLQHAVQANQANVKQLRWAYKKKRGLAPASGIIEDTFYRVGEEVPPNHPIASLLTAENIHVVFFVSQSKLANLHLGDAVSVTVDGVKTPYAATISYISPQVEFTPPVIYSRKNNRKLIYRVHAKFSMTQALKMHPGQPVYVQLSGKRDA